eukprot:14772960-Alexandrium_andersonii.AAC.1
MELSPTGAIKGTRTESVTGPAANGVPSLTDPADRSTIADSNELGLRGTVGAPRARPKSTKSKASPTS